MGQDTAKVPRIAAQTVISPKRARLPAVGTRPETELLLCCARTSIDAEGAERIKSLLQKNIDWAYLIELSQMHGVMPLVYRGLNSTASASVPKALLHQLQTYFHANAAHNVLLTTELLRLLAVFEQQGISAIPFKGVPLAIAAYGNLSFRQFSDLDILVHQRDISRARDLIRSQGYRLKVPLAGIPAESDPQSKYSIFVRHDGWVRVDLQWSLTRQSFSCPLDFDSLWERVNSTLSKLTNLCSTRGMQQNPKEFKRFPHAPHAPLPELAEFLAPLRVHFSQAPSAETLRRYLTGLLSEHPNKNCDTLADIIPDTTEQQLQHLLTDMVWEETHLNRQRIAQMQALGSEGDGVLIFDDTGFEKRGSHAVGVARQYTGTAGKVTNCQVTVNCHYAERTLAWPVATRLYLPQEGAEDAERRKQAHVPEEVTFQTKAEIALALLDEAKAWGVRHACVTCDADYGDNPYFLNGWEERGERHVVAVRADFSVAFGRSHASPVRRADAGLAEQPPHAWHTLTWSEGANGWERAQFVARRCWRVDGDGTRHVGWVIGQRPALGQSGDGKYFWSDFPASTPLTVLVEYAHRRHWLEQYHEEAKTELGWDQYQGRRWDGFHRHAIVSMLSFSFLVWLDGHTRAQRPVVGRPRAAFSPSPGPPPHVPAGGPSPGQRMAPLRSDS